MKETSDYGVLELAQCPSSRTTIRLTTPYAASSRAGVKFAAQRTQLEDNKMLKKRYSHMPEISSIARHRRLPKIVHKAAATKEEMLKSDRRRRENERRHSKLQHKSRTPAREKIPS